MTTTQSASAPMPTLPQSLVNLIAEYGLARTDGVSDVERLHRWGLLIAGIKDYARSAACAEPAPQCICGEPNSIGTVHRTDGPCYQAEPAQLGGLTNDAISKLAEKHGFHRADNSFNVNYSFTLGGLLNVIESAIAQAAPAQQAGHAPAGWIDADQLLPSSSVTDDSLCMLGDKQIPPAINSHRVLVALTGGGVRVDRVTGLEGKPVWWETYGQRVTHWMELPAAPQPGEKNG